ncbi:MAG: hypothetical protein KAT61_01440, partial [Gammaproteobacteria bacterium]|nr:hypothetical protein [Gammaproteobacteria bacterium]
MFEDGRLNGYCRLLAKKIFVGSVFLCLAVNVLRNTLLPAFLNRFAHAVVAAVVSVFAPHFARTSSNMTDASLANTNSHNSAYGDCGRDLFETGEGRSSFGFSLLLFALLMGGTSNAMAGMFCSAEPFNGVVDGNERAELGGSYTGSDADAFPTQITIDTTCKFQNFTEANPLNVTLNFQTNDPSVYLITFNNVVFTGKWACSNIDHRIWFVNGSYSANQDSCQDYFIPVEAINKQSPAGLNTVGIGDPFTYTLTIPVLYDPVTETYINSAGSADDLHTITIYDDLNATGADLTLVGTPTVVWDDGLGTPVAHDFFSSSNEPEYFSNPGAEGSLKFIIDPGLIVPAGEQILIEITVVADATNATGTTFVNTAKWTFGRFIVINGVDTWFDPLDGENGVTQPMTIRAPDLEVNKSASITGLNAVDTATFTIDVQNVGGSDAWDATIRDLLPDIGAPGADTGMCDFDPTATVTAQVFAADGITDVSGLLAPGVDYTITYNDANHATLPCQMSFTMLSQTAVIGPTERLIITYDSILDLNGTDVSDSGTVLTNVAGAEQWFSADPAGANPYTSFVRTITDGSPGIDDFEDSFDITATLTGFVFQKTVENVNTG